VTAETTRTNRAGVASIPVDHAVLLRKKVYANGPGNPRTAIPRPLAV
jgi:hypothetical protein